MLAGVSGREEVLASMQSGTLGEIDVLRQHILANHFTDVWNQWVYELHICSRSCLSIACDMLMKAEVEGGYL